MSIEHADFTCANSFDFVRVVAKLKDIAGQTFDREIFIESADESFRRLENHPVFSRIGNCAAVSDRHQSRSAPAAYALIHRIVMKISPAPSAPGGESFRKHSHNFVKLFAFEIFERI